jgi:spermidine synthase
MPTPSNGWSKMQDTFDFIVVDFPDPSNYSLGKLYTNVFYRLLEKHLAARGAAVQTTSPLYARQSFWCIVRTMESVGLRVTPYHAYVPAFGEWGLHAGDAPALASARPLSAGLRFLTPDTTAPLFQFPPDMGRLIPRSTGSTIRSWCIITSGNGALARIAR